MSQYLAQRISKIRETLATSPYDAILINDINNVRYLSGFNNDDLNVAFLIISHDSLYLITDYRYWQQANDECPAFEVIVRDRQNISIGRQIKIILANLNAKSLAFEHNHIGFAALKDIMAELGDVTVEGVVDWVEKLRIVKDPAEIESIKKAAMIGDNALAELVKFMQPGMTEREVALELEYRMQKAGSEGMSFATILLAGDRTSLPHGRPTSKILEPGDLITVDFGAVVNGYRTDMTRAFVIGEPDEKQLSVYETVKAAQRAGLEGVGAGVKGSYPLQEANKVLEASEFSDFRGEGIGHGLGLYVHEQPSLGLNCDVVLEENMIITIEPGIYIPGWGGIRIEDDVRVTQEGCEILTHSPRDLIVIE